MALTISHYNGFFKRMGALLQMHSCFFSHSMKQRLLGNIPPKIFRKSSYFLLWKTISPKIYWYSPKIKHFGPSRGFWTPQKIWTGYATESLHHLSKMSEVNSHMRKSALTIVNWSEPLKIRCHVVVTQQRATSEQRAHKFGNVLTQQTKEWTWVICKLITASH